MKLIIKNEIVEFSSIKIGFERDTPNKVNMAIDEISRLILHSNPNVMFNVDVSAIRGITSGTMVLFTGNVLISDTHKNMNGDKT